MPRIERDFVDEPFLGPSFSRVDILLGDRQPRDLDRGRIDFGPFDRSVLDRRQAFVDIVLQKQVELDVGFAQPVGGFVMEIVGIPF
jgi:hypothetical protein